MKLTAREIAELVGGEICGDENTAITGIAPLKEATTDDLSFLNHAKYQKDFESSQAGLVLLKKGAGTPPPKNRNAILVNNPQLAFTKILEIAAQEKEDPNREIHSTALISPGAKIGAGVSVGAYTVIEMGAVVGDGTRIGAQCYIGRKTAVGKNCKIYPQVALREEVKISDRVIIHSGTVIGADGFGYVTTENGHCKIPQIGTVEIGDDVEIGANVTIDRATMGKTVIGKGTKIDNLVQIAHNVKVGEGCLIAAQSAIAGSSELGKFVTFGGQVGVADHVTVGERVIVAAQSGIPNDVAAGTIVFGTPARPIQQARRIQAILAKLPEIYESFRKMKKALRSKGIEFDQKSEND